MKSNPTKVIKTHCKQNTYVAHTYEICCNTLGRIRLLLRQKPTILFFGMQRFLQSPRLLIPARRVYTAINSAKSSNARSASRKAIPAFQIDNRSTSSSLACALPFTVIVHWSIDYSNRCGTHRDRDVRTIEKLLDRMIFNSSRETQQRRKSRTNEFRAWGRSVTSVEALSSGSVGRRATEHFAPPFVATPCSCHSPPCWTISRRPPTAPASRHLPQEEQWRWLNRMRAWNLLDFAKIRLSLDGIL